MPSVPSSILPWCDVLSMLVENLLKQLVGVGPGSYTGVRMAVTVCKMLSVFGNKNLYSISTLKLMASGYKGNVLTRIDARRGNVFAGIYDKELNIIKEDKMVNLENLKKSIDSNYTIVSYDLNNVNIDVLKIVNKHKNDLSINPHSVNPNYLKLTEAEESRLKND